MLDKVREILSKTESFPLDKVILSAIHTNTSYVYANRSDTTKKFGSSLGVLSKIMPNVKYEELVTYSGDDYVKPEEAFELIAEKIAKAVELLTTT